MSPLQSVPLAVAIPVALFVVLGSTLTLIGALGFARLSSFYDRLHAPTLATSWGTGGVIIASALLFGFIEALGLRMQKYMPSDLTAMAPYVVTVAMMVAVVLMERRKRRRAV